MAIARTAIVSGDAAAPAVMAGSAGRVVAVSVVLADMGSLSLCTLPKPRGS